MGTSLDEIKNTTKAEMNVVVSVSGLEVARYLKKKFHMPYCIGIPIGEYGLSKCINSINNKDEEQSVDKNSLRKDKVLIIGEQVFGNSIRDILINEYNFENVDVATFFILDEEIKEKSDFVIENENLLIKKFREDKYDYILADPLLKELLPEESKAKFIDFAHVAVSSKIYWDNSPDIIGNKIYKILDIVNN